MESMEPTDIDWSRVVSRYVRDETYEGIAAPRWADLADPNADVDDEAWFCRPDCRHPKTAEDFFKLSPSPKSKLLRSVSAMLPFTERDANATNLRDGNCNLKWRGGGPGGAIATFASPKPKPAPKKRVFREDSENQDPALATPPQPPAPANNRPPFGGSRWTKNAKEAIKSSAEKRPDNAEKEALLSKKAAAPRQLKSTLSARNLFSGKDILGQISEFYDELKRMIGGPGNRPVADTQLEEISLGPMKGNDVKEKLSCDDGTGGPLKPTVKELARQETVKKSPSPMKAGKKVGLKVEAGKQKSPSVLKEVKVTPPTPHRFPSPSANRIKNVKAGGMATASSPVKKPLKMTPEKGTPSKDPENKREAMRQPFGVKDMNNSKACDAEGTSSSLFWFFKPCASLVE